MTILRPLMPPQAAIPADQIAAVFEIPGIASLGAALLMRDGTWAVDPALGRLDRICVQHWIGRHGRTMREANLDLCDPEVTP